MAARIGDLKGGLRILYGNFDMIHETSKKLREESARAHLPLVASYHAVLGVEIPAEGEHDTVYSQLTEECGFMLVRRAHNGIYFRPDIFELRSEPEIIYLTKNGEKDGEKWDSMFVREAMCLDLVVKEWDMRVALGTTHIDNVGIYSRVLQTELALDLVDQVNSPNSIFGADFNADKGMSAHMQMPTDRGYENVLGDQNPRTFHGLEWRTRRTPDGLFDRAPELRVLRAGLLPQRRIKRVKPSDHEWIEAVFDRA